MFNLINTLKIWIQMLFLRIILITFLAATISSPAKADFFSDVTGILTDPLKIGKGSENLLRAVERAFIHAQRLQDEVDDDIRDYIDEIDGTISDTRVWFTGEREATIDQIDGIISNSLAEMSKLEKAFIADTRELIKCGSEVTAESLRDLLADALNDLGERKPRFKIFGITVGSLEIDAADIASPIEGFRRAKALYDNRIAAITEADSPSNLTDAYAEIQRLSDLARCHYKNDTAVYQELYLIELEYNRRGRAWHGRMQPI